MDKLPKAIFSLFLVALVFLGLGILLALVDEVFEKSVYQHLSKMRTDTRLHGAFLNTIWLWFMSSIAQLLLALLATIYIQKVPAWIKLLLILPFTAGLVAPSFSIYVFLSSALGPMKVGLLSGLLGSPAGARLAVVLIDAWQWTGILLLVCFVRLERVPVTHMEQARLYDLSRLRRWYYVVWPNIRLVLITYVLFRGVDWLRKVDSVKALTGSGGPGYACETVGLYLSSLYFRVGSDPSYAAFLTLLQLVVLGVTISLLLLFTKFGDLTEGR